MPFFTPTTHSSVKNKLGWRNSKNINNIILSLSRILVNPTKEMEPLSFLKTSGLSLTLLKTRESLFGKKPYLHLSLPLLLLRNYEKQILLKQYEPACDIFLHFLIHYTLRSPSSRRSCSNQILFPQPFFTSFAHAWVGWVPSFAHNMRKYKWIIFTVHVLPAYTWCNKSVSSE